MSLLAKWPLGCPEHMKPLLQRKGVWERWLLGRYEITVRFARACRLAWSHRLYPGIRRDARARETRLSVISATVIELGWLRIWLASPQRVVFCCRWADYNSTLPASMEPLAVYRRVDSEALRRGLWHRNWRTGLPCRETP